MEQLLNRQGNERPSQDCVVSVFAKLKEHQDDAKLASVDYLLQQGAIQKVLGQIDLKDMLPKASARGKLPLVKRLLALAPSQSLTDTIKSAAFFYGANPDYLDPLKTVGSTRDIINDLLNRNHNGPTQESVDWAFRDAVRFSSVDDEGVSYPLMNGEVKSDLHLVKTMLFDRKTGQLRTGLRPSNETIQYHRDSQCTGKKITTFLKSLNL